MLRAQPFATITVTGHARILTGPGWRV